MPVADERRADEKPRRLELVGAGGGGLVWFSFRFRRYLIARLESLFALCPSDPAQYLARSLSRALMLGCAETPGLSSFHSLYYATMLRIQQPASCLPGGAAASFDRPGTFSSSSLPILGHLSGSFRREIERTVSLPPLPRLVRSMKHIY